MRSIERSCGISAAMELAPASAEDYACMVERLELLTVAALRVETDKGSSSVPFIQRWVIKGFEDEPRHFLGVLDFREVTFRITFGSGIPERFGSDDARTLLERVFAVAAVMGAGLVAWGVVTAVGHPTSRSEARGESGEVLGQEVSGREERHN